MPEANVLYSVTAAVVVGLVAWVAVVLKTAKEPWAKPAPAAARAADGELEGEKAATSVPPSSSLPKVLAGSAGEAGADTTAEATAVVVAKKDEAVEAEEKKADAEEKKDEEKKDADEVGEAKSDAAK